jgi:NOL1/NOP2/fmu family ribosome biogenesis protein
VLEKPRYELSAEQFEKVKNGAPIEFQAPDGVSVFTYANKLVSIGKISANMLKNEKVFEKKE